MSKTKVIIDGEEFEVGEKDLAILGIIKYKSKVPVRVPHSYHVINRVDKSILRVTEAIDGSMHYKIKFSTNSTDMVERYLYSKKVQLSAYIKIDYNEERKLYDRQPVWVWESGNEAIRTLAFYDAKQDTTFHGDGSRLPYPVYYDNIEAVDISYYQNFMIKMYNKLNFSDIG